MKGNPFNKTGREKFSDMKTDYEEEKTSWKEKKRKDRDMKTLGINYFEV